MNNKRPEVEVLNLITLDELEDDRPESSSDYAHDEIGPGREVTLHFALTLADDPQQLIDSNFDRDPVSFEVGDGNLLAGFERVLFGLKAGAEQEFLIPARNAFGERNSDNIQRYPRYQFPADLLMEKGLMINFADAAGNEQAGIIHGFDADNVDVDFNHPLAGRDILFRVAIKEVSPLFE